jgi:hypothetical protein
MIIKEYTPVPEDDEWEEIVIVRRKREKKKRKWPFKPLEPCDWPVIPWKPEPSPWIKRPIPMEPTIVFNEPCMIEEFFKTNPNGLCMIACPCPRHRIIC